MDALSEGVVSMGGDLLIDASRTHPGVTCGTCRHQRHKFRPLPGWQQGDGCPCCYGHSERSSSSEPTTARDGTIGPDETVDGDGSVP